VNETARTGSLNGIHYLGFPVVEIVVQLRVDFVVVFAVGAQSDQTQAHERRDQGVISRVADEIELEAVPEAVEPAVVDERPLHLVQHRLAGADLRLHRRRASHYGKPRRLAQTSHDGKVRIPRGGRNAATNSLRRGVV